MLPESSSMNIRFGCTVVGVEVAIGTGESWTAEPAAIAARGSANNIASQRQARTRRRSARFL